MMMHTMNISIRIDVYSNICRCVFDIYHQDTLVKKKKVRHCDSNSADYPEYIQNQKALNTVQFCIRIQGDQVIMKGFF